MTVVTAVTENPQQEGLPATAATGHCGGPGGGVLETRLGIVLFIYLSAYLSLHLSVCLSIYGSVYLFLYLVMHLFIHLSTYLPVYSLVAIS